MLAGRLRITCRRPKKLRINTSSSKASGGKANSAFSPSARAMPRAEAPSCGARGAGGKIARPSLTARIRTSPQPPSQRSASPRFIQASIHGLVGTGGRRDQVCCLFGRRCQSVDLTEWCRCVCQPSRVTPGSSGRSPSSCCCRSGPAGGMPNPRATSCRWPDAKCLLGCRHCR
jgi:hypothetical protein